MEINEKTKDELIKASFKNGIKESNAISIIFFFIGLGMLTSILMLNLQASQIVVLILAFCFIGAGFIFKK